MSKDFPNRSDWLARRATPAKFPGRMIHVSKQLATIKTATGQFQTIVSPAKGSTLNLGRNAEKRAARAEETKNRRMLLEVADRNHALDVRLYARLGGRPLGRLQIPKLNASKKRVNMLANRRLRQRGGAPDPVAVAA